MRCGFGIRLGVLGVALVACGGATSATSTSGGDAGTPDGPPTKTGVDSGRPAGCPALPPIEGEPCASAQLACDYTAEYEHCGEYICENSRWDTRNAAHDCRPPDGVVCPIPEAPVVGGPTATIDKTCDGQLDCDLVMLQTDCCGTTLAYAVNKKSVDAARKYADTCRRTYPGCGCDARSGPVAELDRDGGSGGPIVAKCTPQGCISMRE